MTIQDDTGLGEARAEFAPMEADQRGLEEKPGLLIRGADGRLFFIPDAYLESEEHRLPDDKQPGSERGDRLQDLLNACPPVHRVKNALRVRERQALDQLESTASPVSGTGGRSKTLIGPLSTLREQTPDARRARAWLAGEPPPAPRRRSAVDRPGILIRGADGTLYFVAEKDLDSASTRYALPEDSAMFAEGRDLLEDCPVVHQVKNAIQLSSLDELEALRVSGTGSRSKALIDALQEIEATTPASRSARAWSRLG